MTAADQRRARDRERLLLAALTHVPFEGFGTAALALAAKDCAMLPADAQRLYPKGATELVAAFSAWADAQIVTALGQAPPADEKLGQRISGAIMARLAALAPYREAARRAARLLALPQNAPLAARLLYRTVDTIWHEADDRSVDFAFYTKRASLGLVYGATLLCWFDDSSPDLATTRQFLDRRLADIARIGRTRARIERMAETLPNPFRLFRAAGARR